ncbi:protein BIG GRAIN 1-like B [Rhodamnia argentea]|uniref:Protein BIG GRAIN 1-like B n=1 Tax=Rhodamnia argentea TaxID=178133 RepID=A0A8B8P777_9MYRT|nr:protein BIG GRAIN 1-like B [Rhodamnia argentea]
MYRFERSLKEGRHLREMKMTSHSPSFSSTLLDEIYRSIDGCDPKREPEQGLRREMPSKKQSTRSAQITPRPTSSVERRGSGEANPTADARRGHLSQELPRKPKYEPDLDSDVLYFSSTSVSSDSSSGGFSFSDTESVRGAKTTASSSCFAPFRLNPVRTRVAAKRDERQRAPFGQQRESQEDQGGVLRSAASRIYANLKKVKQQPVSPGGRLVSFISSMFSTTPKSAKRSDRTEAYLERKLKSGEASTSTSASSNVPSLSRPCLSKRTPSTRERLRSETKRTVRFYPVSVIVDEDCRPCGHKCLHQEGGGGGEQSSSVSLSVPTAWRIGKSQPKRIDQDWTSNLKDLLMEKSKRFEGNVRELLRDYGENQKQGFELKGQREQEVEEEEDDDDDGGVSSCSSSDLFELDLLAAINDKYNAELPVYEKTYFDKRRVSRKEYRV